MNSIYIPMEANSVYDYVYKWLLDDIRQDCQIHGEDFDIDEYMRIVSYDDFFSYRKEAEEFANTYKDDYDLNQYFSDIFYENCFSRISENQRPNGFLVNFINNLTFERALKIVGKFSFWQGDSFDTASVYYNHKKHKKLYNLYKFGELPQYRQDICHTINAMIGSIKDTVNFTIRNYIEDIREDIEECIEGFKEVFGDDVENLFLKDEAILHAVIIALDRKLLECPLNEAGEELARLLYNAGINHMYSNDNKHPVDIESFDIRNETLALCDRNETPKKKQKAKGARI